MPKISRRVLNNAIRIGVVVGPTLIMIGMVKTVDYISKKQDIRASADFVVREGETIVFDEEFKRIVRQEGLT